MNPLVRRIMGKRFFLIRFIVSLLLMSAILTSCAPTYDNVADQMLVDTEKQADDGLLKLENLGHEIDNLKKSSNTSDQKAVAEAEAQASYASNIDFYSKLQSSMTVLAIRMTSNPDLSTQKISTTRRPRKEHRFHSPASRDPKYVIIRLRPRNATNHRPAVQCADSV